MRFRQVRSIAIPGMQARGYAQPQFGMRGFIDDALLWTTDEAKRISTRGMLIGGGVGLVVGLGVGFLLFRKRR
jgi:hypothetical protein